MSAEPAVIPGFRPFVGQHCETVATGSLLRAAGVELSEPMLFGIGEGLGFIFLNLGSLPLPFLGGRVKPFALTASLCANLGVPCTMTETTSRAKAWASLEKSLGEGYPVGLQLDCYHLEYFSRPIHFAAHFVAAFAIDEREVHVVDTEPQGCTQRVARRNLEAARFEKGPLSARARSWTVDAPKRAPELAKAIRKAIVANARDYLSPGFKGASFEGIRKLAGSLPGWLGMSQEPARDLALTALLMENAGTGGSLFRNFYRDFLLEAREYLGAKPALKRAHEAFALSAGEWAAVAALIRTAGRKADDAPLREAAERCTRIAALEVGAMSQLVKL